jgi:hypothetical protein
MWERRSARFSGSILKREHRSDMKSTLFRLKTDILIRTWGFFCLIVLFHYGFDALLILLFAGTTYNGHFYSGAVTIYDLVIIITVYLLCLTGTA